MQITEIFKTIQGEGMLTGTVSVIIRLWGCNLKCRWCDEKNSSMPGIGYTLSLKDLIKKIAKYNCKNIVITGGEPLIHHDIVALTNELKKRGYFITIETNATIIKNVSCDLISMSPKLSHSVSEDIKRYENHEGLIKIDVIKYYIKKYDYQIKFVVEHEKNFNEIENILSKIGNYNRSNVLIMPLASSRKQLFEIQKKVVDMCIKRNWRYCNRLQLQIWGKNKETKK